MYIYIDITSCIPHRYNTLPLIHFRHLQTLHLFIQTIVMLLVIEFLQKLHSFMRKMAALD